MISRAIFAAPLLVLAAVAAPTTAPAEDGSASLEQYLQEIADWRERRHQRLASDDGWMTLVGLEWLQEGENRVGSSESSDARIPGGPADWGTIVLDGDRITFRPAAGADVTVDDANRRQPGRAERRAQRRSEFLRHLPPVIRAAHQGPQRAHPAGLQRHAGL